MSKYVDGFVLVVPKKKVAAYRRIAAKAGKIWMRCGALDYKECVGDDLRPKHAPLPFPKLIKARPTETVFFSYIVFKSRAHRDQVNARVMKDPYMNPENQDLRDMPFDMKRMSYGGFKVLVDARR